MAVKTKMHRTDVEMRAKDVRAPEAMTLNCRKMPDPKNNGNQKAENGRSRPNGAGSGAYWAPRRPPSAKADAG